MVRSSRRRLLVVVIVVFAMWLILLPIESDTFDSDSNTTTRRTTGPVRYVELPGTSNERQTTRSPLREQSDVDALSQITNPLERDPAAWIVDSRPHATSPAFHCNVETFGSSKNFSAESPPTACPPLHRIRCNQKLGRALVLYMLHTKKPTDVIHEIQNFHYFSRYGVYGPEDSTDLFSGVDYIFTRVRPNETDEVKWEQSKLSTCAEASNVKLMWVSNVGADLCAHFKVFLEELGGLEAIRTKYAYVVVMNAGARGPFQSSGDASWIDVFAMGGRSEISDPSQLVVSGPTISSEQAIHVQSYVIGVPTTNEAFSTLFNDLAICQQNPPKLVIISAVEVGFGMAVLRKGLPIHSLHRQATIRNMEDAKTYTTAIRKWTDDTRQMEAKRSRLRPGPNGEPVMRHNPTFHDIDPCGAVFLKFGGVLMWMGGQPDIVVRRVEQLTMLQPPTRELRGKAHLAQALTSLTCDWLSMGLEGRLEGRH